MQKMICSKFPHEINAKADLPGTFIIFICKATLRGKAKFQPVRLLISRKMRSKEQ